MSQRATAISSPSPRQAATVMPLGATIWLPAMDGTPSSVPPLATPTTHMPFWYAPDCRTSVLW